MKKTTREQLAKIPREIISETSSRKQNSESFNPPQRNPSTTSSTDQDFETLIELANQLSGLLQTCIELLSFHGTLSNQQLRSIDTLSQRIRYLRMTLEQQLSK